VPDSPGWELITALVWSQSPLEEARAALAAVLSHFGGALAKGSMPHVLEPSNPLSAAGSVPYFPLSRRTFTGAHAAAHSCCGPAQADGGHGVHGLHTDMRVGYLPAATSVAMLSCRAAGGV
jgi:hypothetical protein